VRVDGDDGEPFSDDTCCLRLDDRNEEDIVTAGAAGVAALLSTMSSAANMGSAGAIIIAGSGLPPRSARGRPGDDITGNKAVRELIAKSKPNYY
jgi:hypothetical protein